MHSKVVVLNITTYAGYCVGASHYYGALHSRDKRIELGFILTKKTAPLVSHKDYQYKAGQRSIRFISEKDIRRVARREWKKNFPDSILLLEGTPACGDPQRCLEGPKELKKEINRLKNTAEKIGWYEGDDEGMTKISDEYMNLLRTWKLL